MGEYANLNATQFNAWLERVKSGAPFKAGLRAGAVFFKGRMSIYPPVRRQKMIFKSIRHLRGFFAALRRGDIEIPYRRVTSPNSETASKRWATSDLDDGMTQVVGNNASYAGLLYSPRGQSWYHKGNWLTTEQRWKQDGDETRRVIFESTRDAMRKDS
jgi:hypothetical protein